jgi:hypothetical protein
MRDESAVILLRLQIFASLRYLKGIGSKVGGQQRAYAGTLLRYRVHRHPNHSVLYSIYSGRVSHRPAAVVLVMGIRVRSTYESCRFLYGNN